MNEMDAAHEVELRARVLACRMAVQVAREDLIERLGDHMCGGKDGLIARADLKVLARARRTWRQASDDLAQYLMVSTLRKLGRMQALPSPPSATTTRPAPRPGSSEEE